MPNNSFKSIRPRIETFNIRDFSLVSGELKAPPPECHSLNLCAHSSIYENLEALTVATWLLWVKPNSPTVEALLLPGGGDASPWGREGGGVGGWGQGLSRSISMRYLLVLQGVSRNMINRVDLRTR